MKKLFPMLMITLMIVISSITSFAGSLQGGIYRPYGLIGYRAYAGYGTDYTYWIDDYYPLITIGYIDTDCLVATKKNETVTYVCEDPINSPNIYYSYYDNGEVMDSFYIYDDNVSFLYMRNVPPLHKVYVSGN